MTAQSDDENSVEGQLVEAGEGLELSFGMAARDLEDMLGGEDNSQPDETERVVLVAEKVGSDDEGIAMQKAMEVPSV